jgi:hypothetical protein
MGEIFVSFLKIHILKLLSSESWYLEVAVGGL